MSLRAWPTITASFCGVGQALSLCFGRQLWRRADALICRRCLKESPSPRWLAICRHRVKGYRAPFVLILQHPLVYSVTRVVAPVVVSRGNRPTILTPRIIIGEDAYRAVLLEMTRTAVSSIGQAVDSARLEDENTILTGLDAIFRGYPVGLPLH